MDEDLKGKARHVGGKLRESVGELLGDREMRAEGRLEQAEGAAEQDAARAKEDLKEASVRRASARRLRKRP